MPFDLVVHTAKGWEKPVDNSVGKRWKEPCEGRNYWSGRHLPVSGNRHKAMCLHQIASLGQAQIPYSPRNPLAVGKCSCPRLLWA
jgi:hypothetical protein